MAKYHVAIDGDAVIFIKETECSIYETCECRRFYPALYQTIDKYKTRYYYRKVIPLNDITIILYNLKSNILEVLENVEENH